MGDIGADVPVATSDDAAEFSSIVGHDKGESVKFPRNPYRTLFGPFHQLASLLGLGQREGCVFVFFFLACQLVFAHFLRGRVG